MFHPSLKEIASHITSECCTLFVGAGLSMGAGLPGWQQLIGRLLPELGGASDSDFLAVAQAYEKIHGRKALLSRICELTSTVGKTPTEVHNLLPSLGIQTWVTTNYDDLLEVSLTNVGSPPHVVVEAKDLATWNRERVRLIKYHGDRLH